jgi:hypothetical protein
MNQYILRTLLRWHTIRDSAWRYGEVRDEVRRLQGDPKFSAPKITSEVIIQLS